MRHSAGRTQPPPTCRVVPLERGRRSPRSAPEQRVDRGRINVHDLGATHMASPAGRFERRSDSRHPPGQVVELVHHPPQRIGPTQRGEEPARMQHEVLDGMVERSDRAAQRRGDVLQLVRAVQEVAGSGGATHGHRWLLMGVPVDRGRGRAERSPFPRRQATPGRWPQRGHRTCRGAGRPNLLLHLTRHGAARPTTARAGPPIARRRSPLRQRLPGAAVPLT